MWCIKPPLCLCSHNQHRVLHDARLRFVYIAVHCAGRSKGKVGITPKGAIQLQYSWGASHGGNLYLRQCHCAAHCLCTAGRSKGRVGITPKGTIQLQYNWGAPHGGTGIDEFSIDPQGRLRLCTIATVGNESVEYCQVYNKK